MSVKQQVTKITLQKWSYISTVQDCAMYFEWQPVSPFTKEKRVRTPDARDSSKLWASPPERSSASFRQSSQRFLGRKQERKKKAQELSRSLKLIPTGWCEDFLSCLPTDGARGSLCPAWGPSRTVELNWVTSLFSDAQSRSASSLPANLMPCVFLGQSNHKSNYTGEQNNKNGSQWVSDCFYQGTVNSKPEAACLGFAMWPRDWILIWMRERKD